MSRRPVRPWQSESYGRDRNREDAARGRRAKVRRVDLHCFDVMGATEFAITSVREAYLNGYQYVELLHGAADVTERVEPGAGRGGIKWKLRTMLDHGQFDAFCRGRGEHQVMEGMVRLALRPNPQARGEAWSSPPPRRHA
jgi:hypothetical protein